MAKSLLIVLLLSQLLCFAVEARLWQGYCDLRSLPVVELARNPKTQRYVQTSNILQGGDAGESIEGSGGDAISVSNNGTAGEAQSYEGWFRVYVRDCECAHPSVGEVFCPAEYDYCAVPSTFWSHNWFPACLNFEQRQTCVRIMWPICCVWLAALVVYLLCSQSGRNVLHYVFSCFYPRWQKVLVDRIRGQDPRRTRRLLRSSMQRRIRQFERNRRRGVEGPSELLELPPMLEIANEERRPTQLALKTRVYHEANEPENKMIASSPDEEIRDEVGDGETLDCTICFGSIENGERIGALPCDHIFHVECLKSWLTRRAVCPLCQRTDVVQPLYNEY